MENKTLGKASVEGESEVVGYCGSQGNTWWGLDSGSRGADGEFSVCTSSLNNKNLCNLVDRLRHEGKDLGIFDIGVWKYAYKVSFC